MHRRLLNQARLEVSFAPRGPVLIKSGQESVDPTRVGMEFVRTRHARAGDTVYLPGTSLKGALRSQAERALRGIGVTVCDPLDRRLACKAPRNWRETSEVFKSQCPACRTFGSLATLFLAFFTHLSTVDDQDRDVRIRRMGQGHSLR